ncbi:MAG: Ribonuclease BN [Syntrophus sp. SKADARSKE-3]|nr:Ribonuclease BN [Syntrophus sp. SKADARSKE-3]
MNKTENFNMSPIEIQFLGSGDAFGSDGRLQSCVMVKCSSGQFLIDCGASCLIGINRYSVNPNEIKMIFISHLHGDHCGGIPFLILASQLIYKRTEPLLIIGPPGMKEWVLQAMEILFPGSSGVPRKFSLDIMEFKDRQPEIIGDVTVIPYLNSHQDSSSFSLRIECYGKIISYSSDTEWTDALGEAAGNADLFIAEAYFYEKKVKGHMDYMTLMGHYGETGAKRLMLIHMQTDMLAMLNKIACEYSEDGKIVKI